MIKLPCNKCNGCVSSSSHRLKSAGALLMQLRPSLYLLVAATTSNRVRQMDRRNDTALLNRKCDHCLRSPHWTHSVSAHWGPHKTSKAEAARLAAEKAEQERIAAEKAAREKAEAERIAAEQAFKQRVEGISVHFDVEGAALNIPEAEKAVVDQLCEKMKADKSIKIVITGHTDNYGDPRQNLEYYGMRRAEALRDYMLQQGVDASQIKCESKGQTEPVAPNNTRDGRALNRRAHIQFL